MAEASAGWLIPEDAGPTARERAFHLLGGFLDDDQKETAERAGGFTHRDGDRLYWIPIRGTPKCAVLSEGRIEHLCIAPRSDDGMPEGDVALTYLLWLKSDPAGFLAEANVLRSERFDPDLDFEEIQAKLAGPRPVPPVRRRYRTPLKRPGLSRGSSLKSQLDVDEVRRILEGQGRRVAPDVLARLRTLGLNEG